MTSLILLLISLACGAVTYWATTYHGWNALIMVPSIFAATVSATHITKRDRA